MDFWIREVRGAGALVDQIGGAGAGGHHDGAGGGGRSADANLLFLFQPFLVRFRIQQLPQVDRTLNSLVEGFTKWGVPRTYGR